MLTPPVFPAQGALLTLLPPNSAWLSRNFPATSPPPFPHAMIISGGAPYVPDFVLKEQILLQLAYVTEPTNVHKCTGCACEMPSLAGGPPSCSWPRKDFDSDMAELEMNVGYSCRTPMPSVAGMSGYEDRMKFIGVLDLTNALITNHITTILGAAPPPVPQPVPQVAPVLRHRTIGSSPSAPAPTAPSPPPTLRPVTPPPGILPSSQSPSIGGNPTPAPTAPKHNGTYSPDEIDPDKIKDAIKRTCSLPRT